MIALRLAITISALGGIIMTEIMAIPTTVPLALKVLVAGTFIVAVLLMVFLTIKIYKGEGRDENASPKNHGW
jgi:hypothetical protein